MSRNLNLPYFPIAPEQYQRQYFEKNLIKIDITKIKKLNEKNTHVEVSDFMKENDNE